MKNKDIKRYKKILKTIAKHIYINKKYYAQKLSNYKEENNKIICFKLLENDKNEIIINININE